MKAATFIIAIVVVLLASVASAGGWRWIPSGTHYIWSNGVANDGWYYSRAACGKYTAVSQISQTVNIQAPVDWKVKLVSALDRQRENDYFLQAIRESGLTPDFQSSQAQGGQSNAYATNATISTQSGVGYHSVQSHAPYIGEVNIESLMERNARIIERMVDGTGQANAALSDRIGQIVDGQAEALKIQAAGQALVASIQATQVQRSTQATITTQAVPPPEPQPPGFGLNEFHPATRSPTLNRVRAEALLTQKCGKCHIQAAKGNFVLERLDATTFDRVWNAVHSAEKPMPPLDSGIAPLTAMERLILSKSAP